jgi:23S rRNA G2445 N2-methylase RlmL
VSNPPYGERVSDHDELAEPFTRLLGSALKRHFAGWNCYLISADTRLPKLVRLTPSRKTPLVQRRAGVPSLRVPDGGRQQPHAGLAGIASMARAKAR